MRTALLVLGMHRSGTSAFTRVFNLLGADLATKLLPPRADNRRGFWESAELVRIHDEILATTRTTWDVWTRFDPAWYESPHAQAYQARLLSHLTREFGTSAMFVVKDPRMCRLVRLWRQTLGAFGAEARVIIPVRHPLEVAQSLKERHGFSPAKSHLMWLRHVLDAVRDSEGMPRCVVSYDALLRDWRAATTAISRSLDVRWPRHSPAVEAEIDAFLCQQERHHTVEDDAWREHPEIGEWVKRAYGLLLAMTAEDACRSLPGELAALAEQFDAATCAFTPLLQEQLTEREAALQALQSRLDAACATLTGEEAARQQSESGVRGLQSEVGELRGEVGELRGELDALRSELGSARSRANEVGATARDLESQLRATQDLFQLMLESKSWRLTAPLRGVLRILRRHP